MQTRTGSLSRFPRIPPGRHGLPREFVAEHQRRRILTATADLVAKRGFRGTPLTRIASVAGVGRNTFYEHFPDKEACFIAMFDDGIGQAMRRIKKAAPASASWDERVQAGLAAFLAFIAEEPALARACFVESLSADRSIVERYRATLHRTAPFLREGRSAAGPGKEFPAAMEEVIIRSLIWMVYQPLVMGETADVERLLPVMLEFVLAPYVGDQRARQAAESARLTTG